MTKRYPLKVLHIFSGDLWAGAEVMIFHLLNCLRAEAQVEILALSLNDQTLVRKLQEVGVKTWVVPENQHGFLKTLFTARRLFKDKEIDIIHSHGHKQNLLAFSLGKLIGVRRLITTLHGLPEPPSGGYVNRVRARLISTLDYGILDRYFTRTVSVSADMKQRLVREYGFSPAKISVIHNGVALPPPLNCSGPDNVNKTFHIGSVGRLVPVKDFNLFLEVASHIKRLANDVEFSILGEGPLKDQLRRRAQELGIENFVKFVPARSDPFPYYGSIQLLLNTSLHEGIPLSILEAMACGVPVVVPRVGGIPEVIENGKEGILIEKRTPENIAQTCLKLMQSAALRRSMRRNARERFVKHFSSARMASSYRKLYGEMCTS